MANFTITIPNDKLPDLIAAYSVDYMETLPNGQPNPQTRAQYAKEELLRTIKQRVIDYKKNQYSLPDFDDNGITLN
jgi:hypothetical protein